MRARFVGCPWMIFLFVSLLCIRHRRPIRSLQFITHVRSLLRLSLWLLFFANIFIIFAFTHISNLCFVWILFRWCITLLYYSKTILLIFNSDLFFLFLNNSYFNDNEHMNLIQFFCIHSKKKSCKNKMNSNQTLFVVFSGWNKNTICILRYRNSFQCHRTLRRFPRLNYQSLFRATFCKFFFSPRRLYYSDKQQVTLSKHVLHSIDRFFSLCTYYFKHFLYFISASNFVTQIVCDKILTRYTHVRFFIFLYIFQLP